MPVTRAVQPSMVAEGDMALATLNSIGTALASNAGDFGGYTIPIIGARLPCSCQLRGRPSTSAHHLRAPSRRTARRGLAPLACSEAPRRAQGSGSSLQPSRSLRARSRTKFANWGFDMRVRRPSREPLTAPRRRLSQRAGPVAAARSCGSAAVLARRDVRTLPPRLLRGYTRTRVPRAD